MSFYDYRCRACGHEWEEEQRITEPAREDCPACKAVEVWDLSPEGKTDPVPAAQRLISKTGFQLNGSGWFKSGGY